MARMNGNLLYTLIHDFLTDYLPQKRNCSRHTVKAYRTALNQLLDFAKDQKQIRLIDITFDTLDGEMIAEYLDFLENTQKCSIKTRNHKLNCLRSFYSYAVMRDTSLVVYQADLFSIHFKKGVKVETVDYLSENAVKVLLEQPDVKRRKGVRDQFLMLLMYDTAARIQEVIDLRICDIRLGNAPQAKLHGKGDKYRSLPLMKKTVLHYHNYMQAFHPGEAERSPKALFYTIRKSIYSPISDDTIRAFMNGYAKKAHMICPEVPEKIHPHIWRHSRAMHLYQHGMDLTTLSQWLGHVNLSTTLIYAHADTEMKRKAMEEATGDYFPRVSAEKSPYDVNDDAVLKRLYGLK